MCRYFPIGFIDFMLNDKRLIDFSNPFVEIFIKKDKLRSEYFIFDKLIIERKKKGD